MEPVARPRGNAPRPTTNGMGSTRPVVNRSHTAATSEIIFTTPMARHALTLDPRPSMAATTRDSTYRLAHATAAPTAVEIPARSPKKKSIPNDRTAPAPATHAMARRRSRFIARPWVGFVLAFGFRGH